MRQFLAVALVGASLAFTATAAFAREESNDRTFQLGQDQVVVQATPETPGMVGSGGTTPINWQDGNSKDR
jgi:hypothetical protein